jgi:hypothetical protein
MRRGILCRLAVAFFVLCAPATAAAQGRRRPQAPKELPAGVVDVTVVEVGGGNAYLKPGGAAGVRRGSAVTIERHDYIVTSSTANFAVIELGDKPSPREQAHGQASTISEAEDEAKQLPAPRPLEELRNQWTAWQPPADSQHPKPVPLGMADRNHRYDIMVYGYSGGLVSLDGRGGGYLRAEVGMRAHVEPLARYPLQLDIDGSGQRWFGSGIYDRAGDRPTLRVRELQVGYGDRTRYFAGLGRIRYAASTLGALDGLRVHAPLGGGFSAAAFGGVLPDPSDGELRTDSQRFGTELLLSKPEVGLRPEAALVVHGSTYDGKLDERRLSAIAGIYPGQSRIGTYAELSAFDKTNPWGVNPFELTAAGVDARANIGILQLGIHGDMRQQERSRYIAAFLPPSWFCLRVAGNPAAVPPAPDTCDPRATTLYQLSADAGITLDRFSIFVGGTGSTNLARGDAPSQAGAFASARVLRIARVFRLEATGTASTGTFLDMFSGAGGPGVSLLGDRLDASLYYRRTVLEYRVGGTLNGNAVGGYLTLIPQRDFIASLQAEGSKGDDFSALMGALVLIWRPRL